MKTQLAKLFESDRLDDFLTALETLNSVLDALGGNPAPRRRRRRPQSAKRPMKKRPAKNLASIVKSVASIAEKVNANGKTKRAAKKTAG